MKYKGRNTIGRPVGQSKSLGQRVPTDARFDGKEHYLEPIQTQRRCANCGLKTKSICSKCNVAVHSRCFREFHTHTAWTVLSLLTHFYIHFIFLLLLRHYLSDVVSWLCTISLVSGTVHAIQMLCFEFCHDLLFCMLCVYSFYQYWSLMYCLCRKNSYWNVQCCWFQFTDWWNRDW